MRPPRLISLVFCIVFFPIFLTLFSALSSSPRVATPSSLAGQTTGFHSLFSFNIPSSLFPPSAIISLTDDNSTFFLARPAAFGPSLSEKGLSGPLWVGSGFGEKTHVGAEGELGCSDIPGWGEGEGRRRLDQSTVASGKAPVSGIRGDLEASLGRSRADTLQESNSDRLTNRGVPPPFTNDGTDDHLHHPLPDSDEVNPGGPEKPGDYRQNKPAAHADIQSLQESAEIDGKVVLLSRGGCGFLEKVKWAQRRGAVAVIVGDDTRGGSLVTMYARGDTSNVTIPAVFTSYTTAHLLSSLMPPQAGTDLGLDDGSRSSRAMLSGSSGKQRVNPTATTSVTPPPTSTPHGTDVPPQPSPKPKAGVFHTLLSFLGFGSDNGGPTKQVAGDSRRPPTSGNIDWVRLDQQQSRDAGYDSDRTKSNRVANDRKKPESVSSTADGDGFMIGVHDWRDPDLLPLKSSPLPSPTSAASSDKSQSGKDGKKSGQTPSLLKGGSITPGSGQYQSVTPSGESKKDSNPQKGASQDLSREHSSDQGWFTKHFRSKSKDPSSSTTGTSANNEMRTKDGQLAKSAEHEGLWVTLTPTSMSTSPFFDTLLVLVVSPLLTLSVVYALLLIRSRIRRRRWRAPKSIVDRLPVRTYHTISTPSSAASSTRSSSPGPVSPTSPLLGSQRRSEHAEPRSRSPFMHGTAAESKRAPKAESSKGEKGGPSSSLWRRKYTGRQVECVVCLEEYVDGQSRVMSLPCGHEFHAECITPWLTTRRRTCPICKGDVVRSMAQNTDVEGRESSQQATGEDHGLEDHRSPSTSPVPITSLSENEPSGFDPRHRSSDAGRLEGNVSSAPQPSWGNLAALSLSALSGDTVWHQARGR